MNRWLGIALAVSVAGNGALAWRASDAACARDEAVAAEAAARQEAAARAELAGRTLAAVRAAASVVAREGYEAGVARRDADPTCGDAVAAVLVARRAADDALLRQLDAVTEASAATGPCCAEQSATLTAIFRAP